MPNREYITFSYRSLLFVYERYDHFCSLKRISCTSTPYVDIRDDNTQPSLPRCNRVLILQLINFYYTSYKIQKTNQLPEDVFVNLIFNHLYQRPPACVELFNDRAAYISDWPTAHNPEELTSAINNISSMCAYESNALSVLSNLHHQYKVVTAFNDF